MKMCEEMQKLRDRLDKIGIVWEDASSSTPEPIIEEMVRAGLERRYCDVTIYRTHFTINDINYSVIYGYGTYGGYDPVFDKDGGLLELWAKNYNNDEPCGYMTADDVIKAIFKEDNNAFENN